MNFLASFSIRSGLPQEGQPFGPGASRTGCSLQVSRFLAIAFGALVTATASHVGATLIATDHFLTGNPAEPADGEYAVTQFRRSQANGAGQNPIIAGFTGPWIGNVTTGASMAVAQWTAEAGGIASGLSYAQGGRARFAGFPNIPLQRRVQRELSPYAPSDTYYMSVVSQVLTGDANLDGFVGIGFTNTGAGPTATDANIVGGNGLRGFLIGAAGNGTGTDYVVRHVGSTGSVQNDVILGNIIQNTPEGGPIVRYTIVKLEFNDDPGNPNGNSKLTIWQNPTDVSSEAAASVSTTPLEFRTFALSSSNAELTHLTFTGVDYSRAASFDEPRLATSWDSLIGGTADFNEDGAVDGTDFLIWQRSVSIASGATYGEGDGNKDGAVNGQDLDLWKFYAGANASNSELEATAAIPEPSSIALLVVGAAAVRRRLNK